MSPKMHIPVTLIVLALAASACGVPATAQFGDGAAPESTTAAKISKATTTTEGIETAGKAEGKTTFECPVTIPSQPGLIVAKPAKVTYSENFPAPEPWPSEYPHEGMVWYGSEELWTALAADGNHGGRKIVWWSTNFPGGIEEEQPEVSVTWTRLDMEQPAVINNGGKATNAFTPEEGWFMIAGIDPPEAGCWEVEASYKGTTLSYVYEKSG